MPATDDEVLKHLSSDPATPSEVDLLTYALYAAERYAWSIAFNEANGRPPSPTDVQTWISNWTDVQFARLRNSARAFFDRAARDYLADEIAAARTGARDEAIVREVRAAGGFGRQFLFAVLTAILGPLVIAGLLVLGANVKNIPTPSQVAEYLTGRSSAPPAPPPRRRDTKHPQHR